MSSISPAVSQVLQARSEATQQQIGIAIAGKQIDAVKQSGDAVNALLEQAAQVQKQIANGHLDVRV